MIRILFYLVITLSAISCGTSKSVKALMETPEYGIKKVHIENRNSSYDNLTADYLQAMKSEDVVEAERLAKDTLLFMSKGPCLGHCPVYSIVVYNDGRARYDGLNFVDKEGIFESKLESGQLETARQLAENVNVIRMASRYPPTLDMVADVARTKLIISDNGLKYDTTISYGEPQELKDIQAYLIKLAEELSWVQI